MSSNGMISAITSSFRREKKQPKQRDEEEERILGSSRPTSVKVKDTLNSTQSDYGTTSDQQFQSSSREGGRVNDENRLDGNDADVWSSVPGRGLDGRGSIRSVRTYSDDGQLGRRRHLLTKSSYTYLKLTYLLVPMSTLVGSFGLILLARYAWPPSREERRLPPGAKPTYPHPILFAPLVIGLLAGTSMQALRDPVLEGVKLTTSQMSRMFSKKGTPRARARTGLWPLLIVALGIALHTAFQELLRILSLYLLVDPRRSDTVTTTELFQQSYYLAIGWGLAESFWGISRGWFEGVRLWSDLLDTSHQEHVGEVQRNLSTSTARDYATATSHLDSDVIAEDEVSSASSLEDEEDNLLDKIEALQRLRGRKDLEDALGKPFPNIAVAVHILWRLDTLLLNLGLTLVISAFYFNTEPIYHRLPLRHDVSRARHGQKTFGDLSPHRLFPLVVVGIYLVHFAISWIWAAAVRRVGLSAVTWGSLVGSLALFFAGLGSWGGLV